MYSATSGTGGGTCRPAITPAAAPTAMPTPIQTRFGFPALPPAMRFH